MTLPRFTLVSDHLCPYVQRAVIMLEEKRIAHERTYVDLSAKPEWFDAISPLGRVPLLEVGDEVLFESAIICEYLDEVTPGSLHPADPLLRAQHRGWIEFGSTIISGFSRLYDAADADAMAQARQTLIGKFQRLEHRLGDGPYFANQPFFLVDATYAPIFRYFDVFDTISDFGILDSTPKVRAYREALAERPSVKSAVTADYAQRLLDFLRGRGAAFVRLLDHARQRTSGPR